MFEEKTNKTCSADNRTMQISLNYIFVVRYQEI